MVVVGFFELRVIREGRVGGVSGLLSIVDYLFSISGWSKFRVRLVELFLKFIF